MDGFLLVFISNSNQERVQTSFFKEQLSHALGRRTSHFPRVGAGTSSMAFASQCAPKGGKWRGATLKTRTRAVNGFLPTPPFSTFSEILLPQRMTKGWVSHWSCLGVSFR